MTAALPKNVVRIHPTRELEVVEEESNLRTLLEVCDQVVEKYEEMRTNCERDEIPNYLVGYGRLYSAMYDYVKNNFLRNVMFTEDDLRAFVITKAFSKNDESDKKIGLYNGHDVDKTKIRPGMYSGCLLQLLTERNKKAGRNTKFYVNGQGLKFNFLFTYAKHIDEVIVDNFKGDCLCEGIASQNGSANSVAVINCKNADNENGSVGHIGAHDGIVGSVIVLNHEGGYTPDHAGTCGGYANSVVVVNGSGKFIGSRSGAFGGNLGSSLILNNEGEDIGEAIGTSHDRDYLSGGKTGYAGSVYLIKNKGSSIGSSIAAGGGNLGLLYLMDNQGGGIASDVGDEGNIGKIVVHDSGELKVDEENGKPYLELIFKSGAAMFEYEKTYVVAGEEAASEYKRIKPFTTEITEIADSLRCATQEEAFAGIERIKELHKEIQQCQIAI